MASPSRVRELASGAPQEPLRVSDSTVTSPEGKFVGRVPSRGSPWMDRHGIPHWDRLVYLWELLRELVVRDLKLRYKRTILGVAWSLINPLLQWLVLAFVFRSVLKIQVESYLSFLFTGILAWSWLQTSLSSCATCVLENGSLLRRPGFPAPILPVVAVSTNLVQLLFALPILLLAARFDGEPLSLALIALPFVMLLQFFILLGAGYFLSTLHVIYRDTKHLLDVALMLAFYLTPVFYDASAVPSPYNRAFRLNPMLHLLNAYRDIIVSGRFPATGTMVTLLILAIVAFVSGYRHFRRRRHTLSEEF